MSFIHIAENNTPQKRKSLQPISGMHPGGGFVAWPDRKQPEAKAASNERMVTVCRSYLRKGFVAWPERER